MSNRTELVNELSAILKKNWAGRAKRHYESGEWYFCDNGIWRSLPKNNEAERRLAIELPNIHSRSARIEAAREFLDRNDDTIEFNSGLGDWDIALKNGIYNVVKDELREYKESDHVTRFVDCAYNPNKRAPSFLNALDSWFNGRPDRKEWFQRWLGYCLVPHQRYKVFLYIYGPPDTGKSVLLHIARVLLGSKNVCSINPSRGLRQEETFAIVDRYLNAVDETTEGYNINTAGIKALVNPESEIQVRKLHCQAFMYRPVCKHMIVSNHLLQDNDTMGGVLRRVRMMEITKTFDKPDRSLGYKLEQEREGILAWAIEGARKLYKEDGFNELEDQEQMKARYLQESSAITEFLQRFTEYTGNEDDKIVCSKLREHYVMWSGKDISPQQLNKNLRQLGESKVFPITLVRHNPGMVLLKRRMLEDEFKSHFHTIKPGHSVF